MTFNKPLFIAVEGIDGAGKTTLAKDALVPMLNAEYVSVLNSGPISKLVRNQLMERPEISDVHQSFFMFAALLETYNTAIKPLLDAGKSVVVDRWLPSVYAYQLDTWVSDMDLMSTALLEQIISQRSTLGIAPSCYIYVSVTEKVARLRCTKRGNADRMDNAGKEELTRRMDAYSSLFRGTHVPYLTYDNNKDTGSFDLNPVVDFLAGLK